MSSKDSCLGPDFFIVGAPKCGTTAMTHYLDSHPAIYFPPDKEFHYFGSDIKYDDVFQNVRDREKYFSQFEAARDDQIIGETSTWNLYSKKAANEIYQYDPEAKIIMMLRNPVDMIHSLHRHFLYGGNESIEDFEEALEAEKGRKQGRNLPETVRFPEGLYYREVANYSEQVQRYYNVFNPQQLHVILFDHFVNRTQLTYEKTLNFLGVSLDFKPEFRRINPSKKIVSKKLNKLVRDPPYPIKQIVQYFDQTLPPWLFRNPVRWVYRIINTRPEERDPMNPQLRKALIKDFKPMIKDLENLIDRNLSHWYKMPSRE